MGAIIICGLIDSCISGDGAWGGASTRCMVGRCGDAMCDEGRLLPPCVRVGDMVCIGLIAVGAGGKGGADKRLRGGPGADGSPDTAGPSRNTSSESD